ncbi:mRNA capping enzyme, catalytic domain-containing protein [Gaertneriomyces semiglobifer]|nr:mRNA capping enzyme, catalytic domain-containing protein [Gaertneriomyces semiglobifer]
MLPQIPGVLVRGPELRELRARVSTLTGSRNPSAFPGAQPISFAACHLRELENDPYFVSEKADGIRCLLFTTHDTPGRGVSYLIDRKNSFYRLELGLPIPSRGPTRWYKDTLLDGELVLDEYEDKTVVLWFLLFDCVVIGGKSLKERPYHKRLGYLKEQILNPYKYLLQTDPQYKSQQPFRMDLKPLQLAYHLEAVFEDMAHLKHKSDGIIFTSRDAPYTLGTCEKMLKWKPAEENTVDFKIRVENAYSRNPSFYICLWEGQDRYSDYAEFHLSSEQYKEWCRNPPQGAIVECRYDPEWPGRWRFSRFRDDKREANHMNTYTKIMESIRDGVSEEQVSRECEVL